MQKIQSKSLNYRKIECYQKWKHLVFKNEGSSRDRMTTVVSEMITSSEDFNRCVENDSYLSKILSEKLIKVMDIVGSDLLFHTEDNKAA